MRRTWRRLKVRYVGGGAREERTEHWNLEHKGTVKEYGGDQKSYRQWAKRLSAFCNSKVDGFRVALVWAEKIQNPITDEDLRNTGWDQIHKANTKLFDLLSLVTNGDALRKVETTPGEAQGFEAWRRLARQYMPTSRLTRIDRLNALMHVEPCSSMKEVLGKIETWEQNWAKYEVDNGVTLDIDLKLGALLKMIPPKQEEAIKLRYIEDESKLTYPVLRRQVELWMEAIQQGPAPMDLSLLQPSNVANLSEEQLEQALDVLRNGKKGSGKDKGRDKDPNRKIEGKCWNCGKEGHTAQACRQPKTNKGKGRDRGAKSLEEEDDEEESDDDQSRGLGMLGLASLDIDDDGTDDVRVRGEWVLADPKNLDLCAFDDVEISEAEDEDDDDDCDDAESERRKLLTEAIEQQLESRRAIEKEVAESGDWQAPRRPIKTSAQIRGTPLTVAFKNPFGSIAEADSEANSSTETLLDQHLRRLGKVEPPSSPLPPYYPYLLYVPPISKHKKQYIIGWMHRYIAPGTRWDRHSDQRPRQ